MERSRTQARSATSSNTSNAKARSAYNSQSPGNVYLFFYNSISAAFWVGVILRLLILFPLVGPEYVSGGLETFTRWVQTGALLEVLHALSGLVRSPVITTAIQVASRILLVWGVVYMFPQSGKVLAYSTMLFAWSFTEVVRYSYYAYNLRGKGVPSWLIWLRYNTFYVLYPLGVASEMIVTMSSLGDADKSSKLYGWTLRAILVIYIPGTCTSN